MRELNRVDFVFSYWIFVWYLLYLFKFVKYNPKFALLIALIENLLGLMLMIYYKNSLIIIFSFCFVNFFIKVLPLWYLRNEKYQIKQVFYTVILFGIYTLWLSIHDTNPYKQKKKSFDYIKNNEPIGPLSSYLNKIVK
jgi:hypothetical protein